MKTVRLFTALVPDPELKKGIGSLQTACRQSGMENLRFIRIENLHVTVNFLGDTDPEKLNVLHDILKQGVSALQAPCFRPGDPGFFPSSRRARSINLLLEDPDKSMEKMFLYLDGLLRGEGFPGEKRRFRPHISFGRFRTRRGEVIEAGMLPSVPISLQRIYRCSELVLFRSELESRGAHYYPEGRYRFGTQQLMGD